MIEEQATKSYLGNEGDPQFVRLLAKEALGFDDAAGLQTVGGTGALRPGRRFAGRHSTGPPNLGGRPDLAESYSHTDGGRS